MNTPAIAAVLPSAPVKTGNAPGAGRSDAEPDAGPSSFSNVLAGQHGAQAGGQTAPGKSAKAEAQHGQAEERNVDLPAADQALAKNIAEQGLTLPQLALHIAAEVAAVRHAAGTGPAVPGKQALAEARDGGRGRSMEAGLIAGTSRTGASDKMASELIQITPQAGAAAAHPAGAVGQDAMASLLGAATNGRQQTTAANVQAAGRAASVAGAKQAVLTMQARVRAGEASPDSIIPADFLAAKAQVTQALDAAAGLAQTNLTNAQAAASHGVAAAGSITGTGGASASFAALTAAGSGNLPTVATPLNHPAWGADFSRQFVSIAQGAPNMPHTAELRLDPPELGPIRITINISDNVANAVFVSPHAAVRQTVENALPQLQQLLAQAGISLGEASVNDQGQSDQAFHEASSSGTRSTGNGGNAGTVAGASDGGLASALARSPAPNALVDTFA